MSSSIYISCNFTYICHNWWVGKMKTPPWQWIIMLGGRGYLSGQRKVGGPTRVTGAEGCRPYPCDWSGSPHMIDVIDANLNHETNKQVIGRVLNTTVVRTVFRRTWNTCTVNETLPWWHPCVSIHVPFEIRPHSNDNARPCLTHTVMDNARPCLTHSHEC